MFVSHPTFLKLYLLFKAKINYKLENTGTSTINRTGIFLTAWCKILSPTFAIGYTEIYPKVQKLSVHFNIKINIVMLYVAQAVL